MQIEQRERELRAGQDILFDAAPGTDEVRLHRRVEPYERARDGEPRIQVPTGTATRKEDARHETGATDGSVADTPYTRSRSLPMFTRMPVMASVSSRFERP